MNEFLERQLSLVRQVVADYRNELISLNALVRRVEAVGHVVGGEIWEERIFPIVVELETINSELIDKGRRATLLEREKIQASLQRLELIASPDDGAAGP